MQPRNSPKRPLRLDHLAAAVRAFVFAHFAHRRLALLVDRLCAVAFGIAAAGEEEAVLADAVDHRLAALVALVGRGRSAGVFDLVQRAVHDFVERAVEILQQLDPVEMLFLDLVELQFHPGGELHVHDVGERLDQFVGDDRAEHRGVESPVDLLDIFAVLNRLNDAGVGAGPADAELLQLLHQARFGEPRRRLGEMLAWDRSRSGRPACFSASSGRS